MLIAQQQPVQKKRRILLDDSNLVNPEEEEKGVDLSSASVSLGNNIKPKNSVQKEDIQSIKALRWFVSLEACKSFVSMKKLLESDGEDAKKLKKKRKAEKEGGSGS
jgi:hypothetical protein